MIKRSHLLREFKSELPRSSYATTLKLRNESLESLINLSNIQWKKARQTQGIHTSLPVVTWISKILLCFMASFLILSYVNSSTVFFLTFWPHCTAHGILVRQSGTESASPTLEM